jgi:hypothetical protein
MVIDALETWFVDQENESFFKELDNFVNVVLRALR